MCAWFFNNAPPGRGGILKKKTDRPDVAFVLRLPAEVNDAVKKDADRLGMTKHGYCREAVVTRAKGKK